MYKTIEGFPNYAVNMYGDVVNKNTRHHLKQNINNAGYYRVELCGTGKKKKHFIHRLVALSFISNAKCLSQVNHKDGNKLNNRADNLEWCTASDNRKHSFRSLGQQPTRVFDINNGKTKINYSDIEGLKVRKKNTTYRQLAKEIGVNPKYLSMVLNGKVRNERI